MGFFDESHDQHNFDCVSLREKVVLFLVMYYVQSAVIVKPVSNYLRYDLAREPHDENAAVVAALGRFLYVQHRDDGTLSNLPPLTPGRGGCDDAN